MKISSKLYVSFGIIVAFFVAFAIFAPIQMSSLSSYLEGIKNEQLKKVLLLTNIKENQNIIARALRNLLLSNDPKVIETEWQRVLEARTNIGKSLESLKQNIVSDKEKSILNDIFTLRTKYIDGQNKVYEFKKQNKVDEAVNFLMSEFRNVQNEYFNNVNDFLQEQLKLVDQTISTGNNLAGVSQKIFMIAGFIIVVVGIVFAGVLSRTVTKPINKAVEASDKISRGNTNVDLDTKSKDETAVLMAAMKKMVANISSMVDDVKMLAKSAMEGKLDVRADASKYEGEFRELIEGFNGTLDAVIGPLNVAAEYIDRISKGDIPPKITDEYKGDFNEIKNNLNQCIDSINELIKDAYYLAEAAIEGRLYSRADENKHLGAYRRIVAGMNETLISVVSLLDNMPTPCMIINKDFEVLFMNKAGASLNNKTGEQLYKSKTHCWDHFRTEDCQTDKCACKQAMIRIGNASGETIARPGMHNLHIQYSGVPIKNKMGDVVGVFEVVVDQTAIKNAQRLSEKIAKYQDSQTQKVTNYLLEISKGNLEFDPVTDIADSDTMQVKEKFDIINNAIKTSATAIKNLIKDTLTLSQAAVEGKLDIRADITKHEGDYRKIVEGINATLNAIVAPLNVAAEYIDRISKGDIPPKITDEYKGDFNEIKNNLNTLIDSINKVISDTLTLGEALAEGNLDVRADEKSHQGVFQNIIATINKAVDNIAEPLQETGNIMNYLKDGDLTVRMLGQYAGELQKLKENINNMANSINSLLLQISDSADITASAAAEISAIAETLAASAAENSAQVDEIATAIEEMSRTISENAMGATRAAEVAEKNKQIASDGGKAVQQTVNKMNEIASVVRASAEKIEKLGESSKQIGEIISVIDEIADQTNLLALNAAIEAARAGEQGRGFAVVADEVRKLAERTTEATKQIANMIKGIQKEMEDAVRAMKQGTDEVNSGIELADRAGNALREIMQSSQEVWDMINQIAAATEEQSSTAEQVAKNVSSISQVTSDTANRVQDIAKSAEDLAKQTDILRTLLERFKLQKEGQTSYLEGKDTRKLSGKGGRYLGSGN